MLIDSHSHLHFPVYKDDIDQVLGRMKEKNVATITVGTSYRNSLDAVEFSKKYGIPYSVGFHPSHARPTGVTGYLDPTEDVYDEEFDVGKLRSVILNSIQPALPIRGGDPERKKQREKDLDSFGFLDSSSVAGMTSNGNLRESASYPRESARVLAIGECGLDYARLPADEDLKKQFKQKQREAFEAQIQLAKECDLPLIIHVRVSRENPIDAFQDAYEIIKQSTVNSQQRGVMHCFLGSPEWAKKFLDLGFYLSFSGIVTFKKADEIRESAKIVPYDMILTETDCPYLAPEPYRGKQNEPSYVEFVLRKLEEVRGERLEEQIEENYKRLFLL